MPARFSVTESPWLSVTLSDPVIAPVVCGVNSTLIRQLEFAASVAVQPVLETVKFPGVAGFSGGVMVRAVAAAVADVFASVNVNAAETPPDGSLQ